MPTVDQSVQTYYPSSSLTTQVVYDPAAQQARFVFSSTGKETVVDLDQEAMIAWLAAPSFGRHYIEFYQDRV